MAIALDDLGVGHGERVAIVSPNAARFQISFFGVSGYGRVLVPVNYRLNADEIRYIVEHSGATVLLVDPESDDSLRDVTVKHRIVLDGVADAALFAPAPDGAQPAAWEPDEDATASINYTSGTTARPKGVQLTHRNCWLNAATFGWHTAVTDRDVFLHTLPMFHCNGWGMPYAVTGMGVPQVVVRKIDGEEILRRIEAHGVTLHVRGPGGGRGHPRRGGGPAGGGPRRPRRGHDPDRGGRRPAAVEDHRARRDRAGLGVHPDLRPDRDLAAADHQPRPGRVGRPGRPPSGPGCSPARACPAIGVRDPRPTRTARCWPGPITSSTGYWQQPEESAKALDDGWFHTGDKGHIEAGDYLVISDRKKDVIISGGENVSSVEVEDCLYQHPGVAEVAVIGVPTRALGRDGQGPGRAAARAADATEAEPDRALPRPAGPLQVPDVGRGPRRAAPDGDRQAAEVQAARAVLDGV